MFRRLTLIVSILLLAIPIAHADITIPVTSGSSPTCLGRLYSDVLIPSRWGTVTDLNAATNFAQSEQGTVGFTIFFEVRPNAGADYSVGGQDVLRTIGLTAINRTSTTGFVNSHYTTFKAITKNMSAVWVSVPDGSGDLQSTQKNALPGILNGAPTSQDCNGLIYALQIGQNIAAIEGNEPTHPPSRNLTMYTSAAGSLWFNTSGHSPNGNAYFIDTLSTPKFPSGYNNWSFYGQNGVQHTFPWY
jgi:hypothetical protein